MYSNSDCEYLSDELRRVESEVARVSDDQDNHATRDALAMGVGLVVFWPALFVLAAGDDENRLADLKGEHEAMRVAYNQRGCVSTKGAVATNVSG